MCATVDMPFDQSIESWQIDMSTFYHWRNYRYQTAAWRPFPIITVSQHRLLSLRRPGGSTSLLGEIARR